MNQLTNMSRVSSQEFMTSFTFIFSFIEFECTDLKIEKNCHDFSMCYSKDVEKRDVRSLR